jgi:hypothetical protein
MWWLLIVLLLFSRRSGTVSATLDVNAATQQKAGVPKMQAFGNGSSVPFTNKPQKDFNGAVQTIPDNLVTDAGLPESFSPGTPDAIKLQVLASQGQTYKGIAAVVSDDPSINVAVGPPPA